MCGLVGFACGPRSGSLEGSLLDLTLGLVLAEQRGNAATGVVAIQPGGRMYLLKAPMRATQFVDTAAYQKWRRKVSAMKDRPLIVLGHTRLPTSGSEHDNRNNHPIIAGRVVGTHNGVLFNDTSLAKDYHLAPCGEVDSEVLFLMAERAFHQGREWSVPGLIKNFGLMRGMLTTAMAHRDAPDKLILTRVGGPLYARVNQEADTIRWGSGPHYMEQGAHWKPLNVKPYSLALVNLNTLERPIQWEPLPVATYLWDSPWSYGYDDYEDSMVYGHQVWRPQGSRPRVAQKSAANYIWCAQCKVYSSLVHQHPKGV